MLQRKIPWQLVMLRRGGRETLAVEMLLVSSFWPRAKTFCVEINFWFWFNFMKACFRFFFSKTLRLIARLAQALTESRQLPENRIQPRRASPRSRRPADTGAERRRVSGEIVGRLVSGEIVNQPVDLASALLGNRCRPVEVVLGSEVEQAAPRGRGGQGGEQLLVLVLLAVLPLGKTADKVAECSYKDLHSPQRHLMDRQVLEIVG